MNALRDFRRLSLLRVLAFVAPIASSAFSTAGCGILFVGASQRRVLLALAATPPPVGPTPGLRRSSVVHRRSSSTREMSVLDATASTFGKGYAPEQEGSEKLHSGPAERNTPPIIEVLKTCMPASGKVLAVAEGSGQHISAFAKEFPGLTYQPTEIEEAAMASIKIYTSEAGLHNVLPPVRFNCIMPCYELLGEGYSMIYAINLTHISPFEATVGFFKAAKKLVVPGGLVFIYGPFKVDGKFTSDGNEKFDQTLRERDARFGYRDISEITVAAAAEGVRFEKVVDMPANNHVLLLRVE